MFEKAGKVGIQGCPMFKLVSKLKKMRKALKSLNHKEYKNILKRLKETRNNFEHVQNGFDRNPLDKELIAKDKR